MLLVVVLALALLLGAGAVGAWLYARDLDDSLERTDAFAGLTEDRPTKPEPDAMNILVLGSDSRDPEAEDDTYRADTLMLLHLPSSREHGYIVSLPRDLWVHVPATDDGSAGGREAKINSATAWGGVPLAVRTVEQYTDVRVDHVMMVDFAGFVEVTDALGGVEMHIPETIQSIHGDNRVFEAGTQELNGEEALDYIRQRYQFEDGDFTRMRNQQQFLGALMDRATETGTLANPSKLNAFLRTATDTLTVDQDFSLMNAAWDFRHLRRDSLTFLTSPHTGTGQAGGQSVVFPDEEAAAELYAAVREDRTAEWVEEHPDEVHDFGG